MTLALAANTLTPDFKLDQVFIKGFQYRILRKCQKAVFPANAEKR
jgi:hypothetical protein